MNRKALRGGSKLFTKILKEFSVVMAPFAPFFSEYCYQSIKDYKDPSSVHHCITPAYTPSKHPFSHAKVLIEGIRQMRERLRLKIKRPLKSVTIVCNESLRELLASYSEVIQNECNLLDLLFDKESNYEFKITAKPYFENLKKEPETMKAKIDIIRELSN